MSQMTDYESNRPERREREREWIGYGVQEMVCCFVLVCFIFRAENMFQSDGDTH